MAKVAPRAVDQTYVAIRSKLGPQTTGGPPAPPPPPPGIVVEAFGGTPTARIVTEEFDTSVPTGAGTGGFTLVISGDVAQVSLQPVFALLDGTRCFTGDQDFGGHDFVDGGCGGLRDIVVMRDILTMRDIDSMEDIQSMRDITSMRDVVSMRWVQEVDEVHFNTSASPSAAYPHESALHQSFEGVDQAKGLALDTDANEMQIYLGRKTVVKAQNKSSEDTYYVGDVAVLIGDATYGLIAARPVLANSKKGILAVASHFVSTNSMGDWVILGAMKMDTSGFAEGDTLWMATSGAPTLTATEPPVDGVHFRVRVGTVLTSDADGWLYVQPDQPQFERKDEKGVAFGYAPLDSRAQVPAKHLPLSHHAVFDGERKRRERPPSLVHSMLFG